MKTAMWMLLGVVIGAAIVVPWMLLFERPNLPVQAPVSTPTPAPVQTSSTSSPPAPPVAATTSNPVPLPADVQKLKDGLQQEISKGVSAGTPGASVAQAMVASLTDNDFQGLAVFAQQEADAWKSVIGNPANPFGRPKRADIDLASVKALSPQAQQALPLVLMYEDHLGHLAQQAAASQMQAVDLSGRPPPPGAMTQSQAQAYLEEAKTNTFQSPIPPANLPPILHLESDPEKTEDDWLARLILQDIVGQVVAGLQLKQTLKAVMPMADVGANDGHPHVMVYLMQWLDDPDLPNRKFNEALPIDFAWDGAGYSVVAEYLCGQHPLPAATPDPKAAGLLHDLLDLNGPQLAREDVRLSALLQKNPLDASAQGEAALLLTAMAWRENAGIFSDNRRLLCKATAHLALALAVDSLNHQPPDWNAQVANIALRTLAGRETDALGRIDALSAQPGVPDAAKTWLSALRLWATHDWRTAKIDDKSSPLQKICWFQVLSEDLTDLGATRRLDAAGPLAKVPDWGRAILSRDVFSVENGNRFAQSTLDLEMQEADEVNQAEQQPPLADQKALAQALNTPTDDTITIDPDGHATVRVIGPGTFLAASQRHLLNAIQQCDYWMRDLQGDADQAAQFETQMTSTFGSLPHFVIASYRFPRPPGSAREEVDVTLRERSASWFVTDLPPDPFLEYFFSDPADFRVLNDFYNAGEPAGTVYDLPRRRDMIGHLHIDPRWHVSNYSPPGSKASLLKRAYFQQLQELDPDSCPLAEAVIEADQSVANGETPTQKMAILNRFMDYCVAPYHLLLSPPDNPDLGNADLETIYKKEAPLVPDVYFRLGTLLRKEGRDDDAAEADRKGAARAFDDVLVANSVGPLIDYDLAHGKPDEALAMAKRAAQVYSEQGMLTYVKVLEKLNHLDEAESWAKNLNDQYADNQGLLALYVAHPEHFPKQADDLKKKTFPQGQAKVSINSFSGPPATGAVFTSASQLLTDSGLEQGDVVVAFNSIKVESMSQYDYIRAQMSGTDMDLIVWHDNEYREIHASPPDHMFGVGMSDYPVH